VSKLISLKNILLVGVVLGSLPLCAMDKKPLRRSPRLAQLQAQKTQVQKGVHKPQNQREQKQRLQKPQRMQKLEEEEVHERGEWLIYDAKLNLGEVRLRKGVMRFGNTFLIPTGMNSSLISKKYIPQRVKTIFLSESLMFQWKLSSKKIIQ
jgi:hypothetical protein